jgi:hypothetical protein
MEYLAYVKQLELSHWLMIAGAAFIVFGVVGLIVRRAGTDLDEGARKSAAETNGPAETEGPRDAAPQSRARSAAAQNRQNRRLT